MIIFTKEKYLMSSEKELIYTLQSQVDILMKEKKAFEQNEKMFHALVETAVGDIGQDFFNNIVIKLSEWLSAECIIIGQLVEENKVEGFPMYLDGEIIHGFTYNLKNTPCDLTSKKGYCVYEDNLKQLFPKSKDVQEMRALGYVGTALYNKNGDPNGVLCAMSRNKLQLPPQAESIMKIVGARITSEIERIKAQNELELSEKELRILNASKDKFFSIIAHDLKAPFNSLLGFSEVLINKIQKNDFDQVKKFAHLIHTVSKQSYALLNNLLDWSLSRTDGMKFNPMKINLNELLNANIKYFKSIVQDKKITIDSTIKNDIEIFADRNMLNTILRNLVSNAIKYTPQDGVITISACTSNNELIISIMDTGIGIEAEIIKKLFKIEESVSTKGLNNENGTGLGLLLCKDFVEKHKGKIWVESEVGKGSTFSFTLPCV
jgi:signal transduction histidine kinase